MVDVRRFENASSYLVKDLWSGEVATNNSKSFTTTSIEAYDNVTIRIAPLMGDDNGQK
jgi:alpha-galactosidase